MSFSGSCRGPVVRFSIHLVGCNKRWTSPGLDRAASFSVASAVAESLVVGRRGAHGIVRDGTTVIFVAVLDDLNFCLSGNLGCSFVVLGRAAWLAVLPLMGPVITVLHPE